VSSGPLLLPQLVLHRHLLQVCDLYQSHCCRVLAAAGTQVQLAHQGLSAAVRRLLAPDVPQLCLVVPLMQDGRDAAERAGS